MFPFSANYIWDTTIGDGINDHLCSDRTVDKFCFSILTSNQFHFTSLIQNITSKHRYFILNKNILLKLI